MRAERQSVSALAHTHDERPIFRMCALLSRRFGGRG